MRYVLEGSVQKSEDRVRVLVQLIDAIKGVHLWSERYDKDLKDLFALQDEIALTDHDGPSGEVDGRGLCEWHSREYLQSQGP